MVKKFLQINSSPPSELGALCALAGINSLCSYIPDTGKFARTARTLRDSSTEFNATDSLTAKSATFKITVIRAL
jgi:hypothetical protein